jgi:AGZA family xanthine/uracil permease-like MFS transporter
MGPYRWAAWGDVNAFFGLMLDNLAVLVLLVGILTNPEQPQHFTTTFVIDRLIPGTALGVLLGDLVYTALAFRLARRSNKSDVTAMPLGLDTPSTFAVCYLVLLPALNRGLELHGGNHETAMTFAWHVGALTLIAIGIFKTLLAPLGNAVRRWVPRAGLLGSLAAIALVLIAFLPLLGEVAAVPPVGLLALTVILVTLIARRPLPGHVPGALAAVVIGVAVYFLCRWVGGTQGWALVPGDQHGAQATEALALLPSEIWTRVWWEQVIEFALAQLPLILPFGLATIVGGIDCTESAAAAGDEYDTRQILFTEALASVVAGLFGGVIQNTPYIGQPAYKAMGGRAAYTLATGVFIGAAGFFGWFAHLFEWLPRPALFPILIFVGLEITAQSFHATPTKHYPAVALAALPALAYLGTILVNQALAGRPADTHAAGMVQTLTCLANGFIVTSMLWAAALAAMIDGRLLRGAGYLLIAGLCSLVGIIHSPFADARIAWPNEVLASLPAAARFQTPYHWAAAYGLCAALLVVMAFLSSSAQEKEQPEVPEAIKSIEGK